LCEGDRNTKYFHRKAATGARRNRIKRLIKDDGQATENKVEMEKMVTNFFKTMYIVDRTVRPDGVVHLFQ
jgi:hypothetical protein